VPTDFAAPPVCRGTYPDSPTYSVPAMYSWSEAQTCDVDDSRLHPTRHCHANIREIYLPLNVLVTDEDLHPYCWGFRDVTFYHFYVGGSEACRARWEVPDLGCDIVPGWRQGWTVNRVDGPIVASDFDLWELGAGRCVFHRGQWCMRFGARRIAWIRQEDLDRWSDDGGSG
jgi:hypothetical protein